MVSQTVLLTIAACLQLNCHSLSSSTPEVKFIYIADNEALSPNRSSWLPTKSKLYCATICSRVRPCIGFQYGAITHSSHVSLKMCDLLDENTNLTARVSSPGISIYILKTPTSTTKSPATCVVDAALTFPNHLVIFSGSNVYFYNNTNSLLEQPYDMQPVSIYLPGWTGHVDAAYIDSRNTYVYFITDSDVKQYQLTDLSYQATETITQHFSGLLENIPADIDDVIIYNSDVIVLYGDYVHTSSSTVTLASGAPNPLKADNSHPAPNGVTAATEIADGALFFAGSNLYKFTIKPHKGKWTPLGNVVC